MKYMYTTRMVTQNEWYKQIIQQAFVIIISKFKDMNACNVHNLDDTDITRKAVNILNHYF